MICDICKEEMALILEDDSNNKVFKCLNCSYEYDEAESGKVE